MKTAEEILKEHASNVDDYTSGFKSDIIDAMKQYGKEALQEVANGCEYHCDNFNPMITKAEILSLIDELK